MISRTTKQFWKLYKALPASIQKRANKTYKLWLSNPENPGLQFKKVDTKDPIYSVRISRNYRALGILQSDIIVWFWIGKHDIYDQILT